VRVASGLIGIGSMPARCWSAVRALGFPDVREMITMLSKYGIRANGAPQGVQFNAIGGLITRRYMGGDRLDPRRTWRRYASPFGNGRN